MKFLVRLSEFDFEILMLSLSTLIGLPLDIISKCVSILSKPTEPKVSSAQSQISMIKLISTITITTIVTVLDLYTFKKYLEGAEIPAQPRLILTCRLDSFLINWI